MKLFFLLCILSMMSVSCDSFSSKAQTRATVNSNSAKRNSNKKPDVKLAPPYISTFDFKNFTYPDLFAGNTERTFTLIRGKSRTEKLSSRRIFTLRKTYYFDLTGDGNDEAVTHILADGCGKDCDSHSFFYVHAVQNKQLKLIWSIATGAEALGGLKSVAFSDKKIVLESFGNCTIKNSRISARFDAKDTKEILPADYTRFVFSLQENIFSQTSKDVLPLRDKNIGGYRPQISFGEQDQAGQ